MGNVTIETGEHEEGRWRSASSTEEGMNLTELTNGARELARRAGDWIADNPFAALGIAVGSGFLVGRLMRMWALRP